MSYELFYYFIFALHSEEQFPQLQEHPEHVFPFLWFLHIENIINAIMSTNTAKTIKSPIRNLLTTISVYSEFYNLCGIPDTAMQQVQELQQS